MIKTARNLLTAYMLCASAFAASSATISQENWHPAAQNRILNVLPDNYDIVQKLTDKAKIKTYSFAAKEDLPPSVDLRDNCPPVYDQGHLGSCTANAIGFAVQYTQMVEAPEIAFNPSRLYIYYNERALQNTTQTDSGASLAAGMYVTHKKGVCREDANPNNPDEAFWPYADDSETFKKKPTSACYTDAQRFKALGELGKVTQDLDSIKFILGQNKDPIVFGITVYESFMTQQTSDSATIPMPDTTTEKVVGGHAIALVGYDDAKQAFIMRNSWGTSWGEGGYAYIPYGYVLSTTLTQGLYHFSTVEIGDVSKPEVGYFWKMLGY